MATRWIRQLAVALLVLVSAVPALEAAGGSVTVQRVDVSAFPSISAYVSVTNDLGMPYPDLKSQSFKVLEDGKSITTFTVDPFIDKGQAIAVALAIDTSNGMKGDKLAQAKKAATDIVDALGPNDGATVISVASNAKRIAAYTADKQMLKSGISNLSAAGTTALYDGVVQSVLMLNPNKQPRKMVVLFTDGENWVNTGATMDQAIAAAAGSRVAILAVGLGADAHKDVLDKLAKGTGGQYVSAAKPAEVSQTFLSLGDQLRRQYVVKFRSLLPTDGAGHNLAIRVDYGEQSCEDTGSFQAPRSATATVLAVDGLADGGQVSGVRHIVVTVTSGDVRQVDLLVDGALRGTASAAPFAFDWDTTIEKAGTHTVTFRAIDSTGASSEQGKSVVSIAAAENPATSAPTPGSPTAMPTVAPAPTAVPQPPAASSDLLLYAVAAILAIGLAACAAFLLVPWLRSRSRKPPPPKPENSDDKTLPESPGIDDATIGGDKTFVPTPKTRPTARLRFTTGGIEQELLLDQVETTIGRGSGNQIKIEDTTASRKHAAIILDGGDYWLEDCQSRNHTYVNGVVATTRQKLANNDRLKIGETILTFVQDDAGVTSGRY